jgi:uroporphyrinogen decarboxylase
VSAPIDPAVWRRVFKPRYADYVAIAHARGKKLFMHFDGYILDIYDDLIEIGIDAVNSQLFCMPIEEIGRRFAGRITFWGEIDRQHLLPFGTREEIAAAMTRLERRFTGRRAA